MVAELGNPAPQSALAAQDVLHLHLLVGVLVVPLVVREQIDADHGIIPMQKPPLFMMKALKPVFKTGLFDSLLASAPLGMSAKNSLAFKRNS